jgi:hypothetical protein
MIIYVDIMSNIKNINYVFNPISKIFRLAKLQMFSIEREEGV